MLKKLVSTALISTTVLVYGGMASAVTAQSGAMVVASQNPDEQKPQELTLNERLANILNSKNATSKVDSVRQGDVYIPKATKIELKLVDGLNSKFAREGNSVAFEVSKNIIVNGVVVIPKGTEVYGTILKSRKAGGFGRSGRVVINIPHVTTINDIEVPVNGYIDSNGKSDGGAAAIGIAVSVIGGLFMKGTNVHYEPGQLFQVITKEDTDLEATPENLQEIMRKDIVRGNNIVVAPK